MDKIGERAVIQYLHKKCLTPKDIHNDMVATLGKDAPSSASPEMVNKVHDKVMTDRRATERYIASTVGIS